jgi:hypothetical protein
MSKRATKDLAMAVLRLSRGAPYLICNDRLHNYGGNIEGDLLAVLEALEEYYKAAKQKRAERESSSC